ncbi:Peroxidase 47 [Dionaea muscipula]
MMQKTSYPLSLARMAVYYTLGVALVIEMVARGFSFEIGAKALSMEHYVVSCPLAEGIVRDTLSRALQDDPTLAAPLLRMHFHDCWIQGCDASILIDSTNGNTAEKDSPANLSLRGYEVIDEVKEELERQCPGVVSCADIIAMAARDAVFLSGGPFYDIPKGRKDGRRSRIEDTINLPFPTFNSSQLISAFGQRGFTAREMVALSGAHTLGVARCSSFKSRLASVDTSSMDLDFARILSKTCSVGGDTAEQPFDATRSNFDNLYFLALQRKAGLLTSDQTLFTSAATQGVVNGYAMNQAMFFFDFQQAIRKLSLLDVKLGSDGEVRQNCRRIN